MRNWAEGIRLLSFHRGIEDTAGHIIDLGKTIGMMSEDSLQLWISLTEASRCGDFGCGKRGLSSGAR